MTEDPYRDEILRRLRELNDRRNDIHRHPGPERVGSVLPEVLEDLAERNARWRAADRQQEAADRLDYRGGRA